MPGRERVEVRAARAAGRRTRRRAGWIAVLALAVWALPEAAAQVGDPPAGRSQRLTNAARTPADTVPANDTTRAANDTTRAANRQRENTSGADSIFQALLRLEGYIPMEYQGDSAVFRADERVLRLFGPAEVSRQGDRLTAQDTIVYHDASRLVRAYGKPKLSGQAQEIEGDLMVYDVATQRSRVIGGRTQVAEAGANWFVRGDVTAEGTNRLYATKSIFTTDDREEPAYFFEADNIKVIRDRILVGRPARLYFRNVPVFWLPFIVQDLTRGRRSGLLTPEFSVNDIVRTNSSTGGITRGTGRQISNLGFYWAMSDYMDAQLSGAWRSGDYVGMRSALRYRWNSQFLDGGLSFTRYWRDNSREMTLYSNNSWRPDERSSMSLNVNYLSSSRFLREITTDYLTSTQNITSNFRMNRRFDWGSIDLGGNRQQQLANDQVTMELPSLGLMFNSLNLFQAAPGQERWYSNATFSPGAFSVVRNSVRYGEGVPFANRLTQRDEDRLRMSVGPSFSMGNLSLGSNFNYNTLQQPQVFRGEDLDPLPQVGQDNAAWGSSLSYRIRVIGETSVSPTLSLSQDLRRGEFNRDPDTGLPYSTDGQFMAAPMRMHLGASLQTTLYGFLPGFGPFTAIRHKLTPGLSYAYVPEVQLTEEQERIFGRSGGFAQNNLSLLSLNQTFEAKMREPERTETEAPRAPGAARPGGEDAENGGVDADTAGTGQAAQAGPPQERKVTLLALNTSGFNYDFERARRGENGFTTRTVSNSVSSDYLRGLQFTMSHDLFDQTDIPFEDRNTELGRFSPKLTSLSTQFTLGEDTPLLRFLFGRRAGREGRAVPTEADSIPTQPAPPDPFDPRGRTTATSHPQTAGRGPWRMDLAYSLSRARDLGTSNQDLRIGMSFAPTANWAVSWNTNYSIETGEFGGHYISLRRDLYRWEANFGFQRTPYGNTSFDVLVRLKDLPDLKVDYREYNIGANR